MHAGNLRLVCASLVILMLSSVLLQNTAEAASKNQTKSIYPRSGFIGPQKQDKMINLEFDYGGGKRSINMPYDKLLFNFEVIFDDSKSAVGKKHIASINISPKPELTDTYKKLSAPKDKKVVFIYPIFTQAAYEKQGFYDYYAKKCDKTCLTVKIPSEFKGGAYASYGGATILSFLNYSYITDIDVDKDPSILKQFDKVIVLHNEYVTKKEFNAITKHPNVLYLYPNALYAEVKSDYDANTITLVRGHNYPSNEIRNGFGWKHDNSKYEYDLQCDNWKLGKVSNGKMLYCYPDYRMFYDYNLLQKIKSR